jgi:hypothetical protein
MDPEGLPIHGLVAGCSHWELLEENPTRLRARLDFAAWPELRAGFPFPHVLELSAELSDDRLLIATELVPTADTPVPVRSASTRTCACPRPTPSSRTGRCWPNPAHAIARASRSGCWLAHPPGSRG